MLKLKKILSFLIVLSMFVAIVPAVYADDNTQNIEFANESKVLRALDIMDEISKPEKLISRGEMASLIVRLKGLSKESLSEQNQLFYDVPVTHPYYLEIAYCARMGYMSGYGNGIFNPDYKILSEEAVATLVKFLGYSYLATSYGDGFTGYIAAARELNITKGISLPYGECIYYEEVAKLIYNSLFVPLVTVGGISDGEKTYTKDPSKTPLSEYHKMAKIRGHVTATDVTGIKGYDKAEDNTFVVGGYTYKTDNKLIRKYLGYEIEMIYSIDETSENECIVFYPLSDMEKLSVYGKDFVSITQGSFNYTNELYESEKVKLSSSFDFVYNGQLALFDESIIENSLYGCFELISTESNGTYDLVIFNDYKTLVVDSVVVSREIVQGSSAVQGNGILVLDYNSLVYDVVITDEENNLIDMSSLKKDDVITYYTNGKYISGYVTNDSVSGVVTSKDDGEGIIFIDEEGYTLSGDKLSFYPTFKLNDSVTLYLDFMGNVAGATTRGSTEGNNMYIPIKLVQKTIDTDDKVLLKAYDVSAGEIKEIFLNRTIKLDTGRISDSYASYSVINDALFSSSSGTPAVIKLNADGLVNEIDTPCLATAFADSEDGFTTLLDAESIYYYKTTQNYGNKAYGGTGTKFLLIPSDISKAESEDFILTTKPSTSATRVTYAYSDSKNNKYATLIMFKKSGYYTISSSATALVVTRIVTVINDDGEECKKIYYMTSSGTENYFLSMNDELVDAFAPTSTQNYYQPPVKVGDLQVGDIISIGIDNERYLVAFRCLWKSNTDALKSQYQYYSKNRFMEATVKSVDSSFLTVETHINTKSDTYDDIESFKLSGGNVYIVRGCGTNKVTYEKSSMADLVAGDRVLIQALSYSLSSVFIIK